MRIHPDEISSILKEKINDFKFEIDISETGKVVQVGDGIARVYGLDNVQAGELVEFPGNITGMALNLEEDNVGCYFQNKYDLYDRYFLFLTADSFSSNNIKIRPHLFSGPQPHQT